MQLLTVGLPVHNAGRFLPQAVNSLLRQTYLKTSNCFWWITVRATEPGRTSRSINKDRRVRLISQQHQRPQPDPEPDAGGSGKNPLVWCGMTRTMLLSGTIGSNRGIDSPLSRSRNVFIPTRVTTRMTDFGNFRTTRGTPESFASSPKLVTC